MAKRMTDLLLAALGSFIWIPMVLVVALLVLVMLGLPVFFRQKRPGLHGQPFVIIKFRTMTEARDGSGRLLPDEQRLTRFGSWLRASSLDELPELLNVLKGEMSLVGPRPLLTDYLDLYTPAQARRHEVPPGITGWAQVNGRNGISWEEKFALDLWYVENRSLWVDLKILLLTLWRITKREGIYPLAARAVPAFTGSRPELKPDSEKVK